MNHTHQAAEALSGATRQQSEGPRRWWAVCETCLITVTVEAHPDRGPGPLPDFDEGAAWPLAFVLCPNCDQSLDWNSDPTTSWEDAEAALAAAAQMGANR